MKKTNRNVPSSLTGSTSLVHTEDSMHIEPYKSLASIAICIKLFLIPTLPNGNLTAANNTLHFAYAVC